MYTCVLATYICWLHEMCAILTKYMSRYYHTYMEVQYLTRKWKYVQQSCSIMMSYMYTCVLATYVCWLHEMCAILTK